jgi:hypothetical protein
MLGPDLIAGIAQPLRGQVLSKSLRRYRRPQRG